MCSSDLHIEVPPVEFDELASSARGESSEAVRRRVNAARRLQVERFQGLGYACNADIPAAQLREMCNPTGQADQLLKRAFERFGLSARSYGRVLKVARTIADLDGAERVDASHAGEAVQYRTLDRKYWAR